MAKIIVGYCLGITNNKKIISSEQIAYGQPHIFKNSSDVIEKLKKYHKEKFIEFWFLPIAYYAIMDNMQYEPLTYIKKYGQIIKIKG